MMNMVNVVVAWLVVIIGLPLLLAGIANTYYGARYRLPFVPSSKLAVRTMLELAAVQRDMVVLDLGSGTGSILFAASERGARAIGVEINPFLVWFTRLRAWMNGSSRHVTVIQGDIFSMHFPIADVVTMYLPSKKTAELREKLAAELPKHALIVSHGFSMPGWKPCVETSDIHVYRVADLS